MKRLAWGTIFCLLGSAAPAWGAQARSEALLFNLAFEDQTDVFLFPQLLPGYEGVTFHLPVDAASLHGGAIFGLGDYALGVFAHRPFTSPFARSALTVLDADLNASLSAAALSPPVREHQPGQIVDVLFGNGKFGLNLRLHLWSPASTRQGVLSGAVTESSTAFSTELNLGFNLRQGLDLSAGFLIRNLEDQYLGFAPRVSIRYLEPGKARTRLVLGAELVPLLLFPEHADNACQINLPAKGGILYEAIPGKLSLGLLGGLELWLYEPPAGDFKSGMAIPTLELAAEWNVRAWLRLRTALKSGFGIQFSGAADDNHPKRELLLFASGIGVPLGPLAVDATIQYSVWQNGIYLIGGRAGLFAAVTLSYRWGEDALAEQNFASRAAIPADTPAPNPPPASSRDLSNSAANPLE